ncbi:MAG: Gfo/Idh/MocA family oxidoreductase [Streptosporangiales bacterium]|nr:Gfo/Idh/MocA family oxidoreductase [Streptosporangiales bacterium]MBO0891228.1 Gfo/Idh/MocA family oxidoreductase [Acidothermales bacterium]
MNERVRLAPVGLGRWARVLSRAAGRGDVIELVSCYSRDETRRRAFQDEFGIARSAPSYQELLRDDSVEGVVITTPNDTHLPVIAEALAAGKGVYTDKPIAHTVEDAVAIAKAAGESGRAFAVGHAARRLAGSREMKRWIDDGRLGAVSLAEANFSNERGLELTPQTWRWHADRSPGGSFIQLGVHHADNLQYLLGPVRSVTAHARRLHTEAEVPDAVMSIVEFESGALGYIGAGWASPGVYTVNLQGTEANLRYDLDFTHWDEAQHADDYSTLHSQGSGEPERSVVELPRTDMFREQLEEFALAIRGDATIEVGAAEGVRALAVVHAALTSSQRNGAAVPVAEVVEAAGGAAVAEVRA